jgi:hypothetical protein
LFSNYRYSLRKFQTYFIPCYFFFKFQIYHLIIVIFHEHINIKIYIDWINQRLTCLWVNKLKKYIFMIVFSFLDFINLLILPWLNNFVVNFWKILYSLISNFLVNQFFLHIYPLYYHMTFNQSNIRLYCKYSFKKKFMENITMCIVNWQLNTNRLKTELKLNNNVVLIFKLYLCYLISLQDKIYGH